MFIFLVSLECFCYTVTPTTAAHFKNHEIEFFIVTHIFLRLSLFFSFLFLHIVPESAPVIKTFSNLSTTSVMLSWDPPVKPNGIIILYDLNLFGPERNNSFSTTNNFIILEDLLPFTLYNIYVAARTIKGCGPSAVLQFYTDESGEQIQV